MVADVLLWPSLTGAGERRRNVYIPNMQYT